MSFGKELDYEASFRFTGLNGKGCFFDDQEQENLTVISDVTNDLTVKKSTKNQDQNVAHETIKILAYLLNNSYDDPNLATPNTIRREHFFFRNTSNVIQMSNGDVTKENILEMLGTTCGLLEMMLRHNIIDREITYDTVGSTLCLLLLKVIDRCLEPQTPTHSLKQRIRGVDSSDINEPGSLALLKSSEIICTFSQMLSARERLANIPGVLSSLVNLSKNGPTNELRLISLKTISNLADEKENRVMILEQDGLLETIVDELVDMNIEKVDDSRQVNNPYEISEQAVNILMNSSQSRTNQNKMASDDKIIQIFLNILECPSLSDKMHRSVTTCFQYLAQSEENSLKLFSYEDNAVVRVMLHTARGEENDKSLVCHALETIRLMSVSETATAIASYPHLLSTVTKIAYKYKDNDWRSIVAAAVLKRLASRINSENLFDLDLNKTREEVHHSLISSVIHVILNVGNDSIDVIQILSEALVNQTETPENRDFVMAHEILFTATRKISQIHDSETCTWAASSILANLAGVSHNRTLFACEEVAEILSNLINRKNLDMDVKEQVVGTIHDLASSSACIKIMRSNEELMVGLMKQSIPDDEDATSELSRITQKTVILLMENIDGDII